MAYVLHCKFVEIRNRNSARRLEPAPRSSTQMTNRIDNSMILSWMLVDVVGSINEDRRREARMQGEAKVVYDFKY